MVGNFVESDTVRENDPNYADEYYELYMLGEINNE